jgi:hypothetical protein
MKGNVKVFLKVKWKLSYKYYSSCYCGDNFLQLIGCNDLRYELGHIIVGDLMFRSCSVSSEKMILSIDSY